MKTFSAKRVYAYLNQVREYLASSDKTVPERALLESIIQKFESGALDTRVEDVPRSSAHTQAHRNAPETSREAAKLVTEETMRTVHREMILAYRDLGGLTDREMEARLRSRGVKQTQQSVTPRRGELVKAGFVRDSGDRRPTDPNAKIKRMAVVWELTSLGRSAAA